MKRNLLHMSKNNVRTTTARSRFFVEKLIKRLSTVPSLQDRITELSNYKNRDVLTDQDIADLYRDHFVEDNQQIIKCGSFDHTMFESIDNYCSQKFPVNFIKKALLDGYRFEVHGVYPEHFTNVAPQLGYTSHEGIAFRHNDRVKKFNHIRPAFFDCRDAKGHKVFVAAVSSGRDYVFHYASMLRHVIGLFSVQTAEHIKVVRYPMAESSVHAWTNLNEKLVRNNDIVVVGYVEEIQERLLKDSLFKYVSEIDTDYYTSTRFKDTLSGSQINLIGVKFSFWGSISAKIITQICRLGAEEVIYVGKLGSLSSPEDIYSRIFVPSKFLIMYHDRIICRILDLRNNILAHYPEMSTDYHVSVPTVVEEDYIQRKITSDLEINSIDNEVSQMAYAVAHYNKESHSDVSFSALHFATDYIRRPHERDLEVKFDLSNNRTNEAFIRKQAILDSITQRLSTYFHERNIS